MFIGDGAKLVRDAFELAKEKAPAIIFIDELDAIGTKRFDSDKSGDREVQRTMLELLNQLDGFGSDERIKVIAATNRIDILDPALLRSGRLDRKIEFPLPKEDARARILEIHSRKMNVGPGVNFKELAASTDGSWASSLSCLLRSLLTSSTVSRLPRVQRRPAQGRLRRGRHERPPERGQGSRPRALLQRYPRGPVEKEERPVCESSQSGGE